MGSITPSGSGEIHSAKSNFGTKGWLVVIYTGLIYLFSSSINDNLNVTVPQFAQTFGWDPNGMLVYTGLGGFVGIAVSLVLGLIIKKAKVKWPTAVVLLIFGALYIFYGNASTLMTYMVIVVAITALSNAINLVPTQQIMNNWFPRKKGIALGWATAGMCIAGAIIPPIFQALFAISISTPFLVMGIAMIILAIITIIWFKSYPEEAGAYPDNEPISNEEREKSLQMLNEYKSPYSIPKLLITKEFGLLCIIFGFLFIGLIGTVAQMVPRLLAIGLDMNMSLLLSTVANIIGIPASLLWGVIDQKVGTKKTVIIFCIYWTLVMLVAALGANVQNIPMTVVSVLMFACAVGGLGNLMPSMVIQVFGRFDFAAVNSLFVPVVVGIRSCALIIVSAVLTATGATNLALGYRNVFFVFVVLSIIAAVASIFLPKKTISKIPG